MLTWTELTANWDEIMQRLTLRFPHLNIDDIQSAPSHSMDVVDHLAQQVAKTHDLTPFEASEELRDWMFIQSLARQAGGDMRAE